MSKKTDVKELLNSIKDRFPSPNDSFEFFNMFSSKTELGIVSIDKNSKKFDIRGEKTPSVCAYDRLSYVDYGGEGVKRDVVHLILDNNPNMKFPDAVIMIANWLNEDTSELLKNSVGKKDSQENRETAKPYSNKYLSLQIEERNKKENKDLFVNLLKGLFRSCSLEEMRAGVKAFKIGLNTYDKTIKRFDENGKEIEVKEPQYRLFIPEFDENNVPFGSYRYNRSYTDNKGLLRKNCKRVLFGSHLLKYFNKNKPIIVSEGHSDVVVNVAKYLQCITTGSSTTKIGPHLHLLKGRELHFYPDADQPGIKGVTHKIIEIEMFNKNLPEEEKIKYKVFLWGQGFIEKDIEDFKNMFIPLEEIKNNSSLKKYSKKWWLNHFTEETLSSEITLDILEKEQELIIEKRLSELKEELILKDSINLKSWNLVSKEFVPQGFDFIDFHTKYQNLGDKYFKFINKYKFK